MTGATRHRALPAFLTLVCLGGNAAETVQHLAFLRTAPPTSTIEVPAPPARRAPEPTAHQLQGKSDFYDPRNTDLRHLQRYDDAVANLPMDTNGFPDWMRALRESRIQPLSGLEPNAAMSILDLDIIMTRTKEMPFVRFSHSAHTLWLDCSNCHPVPFQPKAGSTPIAMADIFRGKYCGMCHDHVAFITFLSCQRCHSVPQRKSITLPN